MKTFLIVLASLMVTSQVFASEIVFPYQARWNGAQYLTHFARMVPLDQYRAQVNSNVIKLSGQIELNLTRLPEDTRSSVKALFEEVLRGEREFAGAVYDSSRAQISFILLEQPSAPVAGAPTPEPQVVVERMSEEAIRKLEPKIYNEPNQYGRVFGCQLRLLGHEDP